MHALIMATLKRRFSHPIGKRETAFLSSLQIYDVFGLPFQIRRELKKEDKDSRTSRAELQARDAQLGHELFHPFERS